ncbi:MAG: TraR/DksA family transcriptional regulator, partial [Pseudomonadota bacterium]
MDQSAIAQFEVTIRKALGVLAAEEAATVEDRKPVELDQQSVGRLSRMDAMQVQAMAAAQSRRRAAERTRSHAALARIADGTIGACTECGEDIAPKRLELD